MVLGVQDLVADPALLEELRELLGLLDRDRADENGLTPRVALDDVLDRRVELLALGLVDDIREVHPDERPVRGDDRDVELVDLRELLGLRLGGAGHAGELLVHPEVVLERDRRERLVLTLDPHALLGLDGLVQAVRPSAPRHESARELVHDDDLAVLDDVVHVTLEERVCLRPCWMWWRSVMCWGS